MPQQVLLVLPERLRRQSLDELLEEALVSVLGGPDGKQLKIANAGSRADADALLGFDVSFDLVVAHLDIPADNKSCPDEGADIGLEFLKSMRNSASTPCILLADSIGGRLLAKTKDISRCELVETGTGLDEDFAKSIARVMKKHDSPGQADEEICTATVEITIDRGLVTHVVRCRGSRQYYGPGRRTIDVDRLKRLARDARRVEQIQGYPDWMEALRDLGADLTELLIRSDGDFSMHLGIARGMARDENLRIRFSIDRDVHPVALEALLKPELEGQFWMLEAPVSRRLNTEAWRLPLFQDEVTRTGPLNCLIIEADASGYVPGLENLAELKHVPIECQWLEGFLKEPTRSNRRVRFERVERVSKAVNGTSFRDRVRDLLTDGTEWHVVHYGGHSHYDADRGVGHVFFPGERRIEAIDIAELVDWLKSAQTSFVFLSSCRSSHDAFVFELAQKQVPAIVGFRWEIDDQAAKEHTQIFYKELLTGEPSLELAFQRTRKQMHLKDKSNRIWAAPMMILQITD
jgi:CheY-like chemotaxis protein